MAQVPNIKVLTDATRRHGAWWMVAWLALMLGLLFPYFEATRNANERPRLLQGMALVEAQQWAIDGPSARGLSPGPDVARSQVDGRLYPNKPPGTSLVAAVGYRLTRATDDAPTLRTYTWWARTLGGLVPTVLLLGLLLRRYAPACGTFPAAMGVMLYALGTPAASYAHLLYGHQLAALLLMAGITRLVDATDDQRSIRASWITAGLGGALAGAAVGVEYGAVFAALPVGLLLLLALPRPGGLGALVAGLAGALLPVALLAAYHDAVFGSPWSTGYHHVTNAEFAAKHGQGLLGLGAPRWEAFETHFLSADGGLWWWAPAGLLALYGLAQLALSRQPHHREARLHLGLLLLYGLLVSSLSFEGGWRVGPRYIVIVLPSLVLGWAHLLAQIRTHRTGTFVVAALGTYGIVINTLAANLWPHFDLTNIHQPVAEVLLPLWTQQFEPYGVLRSLTGQSALRFVVYSSVIGWWAILLVNAERGMRMLLAIILGSALGLLLVLGTQLFEPHDKGERNLAYIKRIWEPTAEGDGRSVPLRTRSNDGGPTPE